MCDDETSGTDDWVWLDFRTEDGSVCKTNEDLNRDSQLTKAGAKENYHWRTMGDCFHLELHNNNLEFRVQTRNSLISFSSDEMKLCKLKLATVENIYTWTGEAMFKGTGEWYSLEKVKKTDVIDGPFASTTNTVNNKPSTASTTSNPSTSAATEFEVLKNDEIETQDKDENSLIYP